jgi:hypothetical protein
MTSRPQKPASRIHAGRCAAEMPDADAKSRAPSCIGPRDRCRPPAGPCRATASATRRLRRSGAPDAVPDAEIARAVHMGARRSHGCLLSDSSSQRRAPTASNCGFSHANAVAPGRSPASLLHPGSRAPCRDQARALPTRPCQKSEIGSARRLRSHGSISHAHLLRCAATRSAASRTDRSVDATTAQPISVRTGAVCIRCLTAARSPLPRQELLSVDLKRPVLRDRQRWIATTPRG